MKEVNSNMMAQPRKQTLEEIERHKEKERLYDYYGIPYGIFDEKVISKQIERDWSKAIALIAKKEKIPEELEERLLQYKKGTKQKHNSLSTKNPSTNGNPTSPLDCHSS